MATGSAERAAPVPLAARLIGQAVRRLRRERRWSIEHLAERAGLSYQYVCAVETGKSNFSIDVLDRLATGFGLPLPAIVTAAYAAEPAPAAPLSVAA